MEVELSLTHCCSYKLSVDMIEAVADVRSLRTLKRRQKGLMMEPWGFWRSILLAKRRLDHFEHSDYK